MDLACIGASDHYFIEPNSYGAEYASGSALFNWRDDERQLKTGCPLELRYSTVFHDKFFQR